MVPCTACLSILHWLSVFSVRSSCCGPVPLSLTGNKHGVCLASSLLSVKGEGFTSDRGPLGQTPITLPLFTGSKWGYKGHPRPAASLCCVIKHASGNGSGKRKMGGHDASHFLDAWRESALCFQAILPWAFSQYNRENISYGTIRAGKKIYLI